MKKLGFSKSPKPKFNKKLRTLKEIAEMFAKMFVKGNAREVKVDNQQTFKKIVQTLRNISIFDDMGGNSAIMAYRAFLEGCDVLLGASLDKNYYENLFKSKVNKF